MWLNSVSIQSAGWNVGSERFCNPPIRLIRSVHTCHNLCSILTFLQYVSWHSYRKSSGQWCDSNPWEDFQPCLWRQRTWDFCWEDGTIPATFVAARNGYFAGHLRLFLWPQIVCCWREVKTFAVVFGTTIFFWRDPGPSPGIGTSRSS